MVRCFERSIGGQCKGYLKSSIHKCLGGSLVAAGAIDFSQTHLGTVHNEDDSEMLM